MTLNTERAPLVSIVTPVYNGENFLEECIQSVLAQTYSHWRYVIVDNMSTDESAEIAARYAEQDERITLVQNTEFLSAVDNNNHALCQISDDSKYCKVVHADDWLYPECVERMVSLAEQDADIAMVGSYYLKGLRVDGLGLPYSKSIVPGSEVCRAYLAEDVYLFGAPSNLLLRSDVIRSKKPFYNGAYVHWDVELCLALLTQHKFAFVHQVLSYTRKHEGSRTTRIAKKAGTDTLEKLRLVHEYGQEFFVSQDYQKLWTEQVKAYYKGIAKNIVRFRQKDVRIYHREGVQKIGLKFSWSRLALAFFSEVLGQPFRLLRLQLKKEQYGLWS